MAKMSRLVQLVLILFCLLGHSLGVHVFDVYRLMQIDKLGVSLGSRKTSLNLLATTNISTPSRHVLVVPSKNVTVDLIKNLAEKKIDGMLVLLPNSSVTEDNEWNKVERYLQEVNFECPIYFTHLTESVSQMYEYLLKDEVQQESLLGGDSWRLVVSSAEAYSLPKFQFRNYQGWIVGSTPNDAENIPTIAVVANIDSFSVVPGLSKGTDSNGSGVAALFELARLFSKLYSNPRTHGHYNILFLLTNTGRMNYESTKFWLENTESRILDNIEFVLSLDTIGVKDSLNLHVSRSPDKSQFIKLVYDSFSNVSKYHGVEHEIIRKKINISSSYVPWQHEQFARKKLFAATVSTSKDPFHESLRSNIFDNPERINVTNFKRNIEIVAEFLAKIIYNIEDDVKIFRDDLAVDEKYILSTLNTLSEFNRMMPYLVVDNDKKPILDGFENELSKFVGDLVVQKGEITSENIYYDKLKLEMSAYRAKPLIFDVLLTLAIVVYVGILYVAIKGTGDSWEELVKLFSRQKK